MRTKDSNPSLALIAAILIANPLSSYRIAQSGESAGGAADTAPMNAQQLQALVASIAFYPDPLVAQTLAAATFPDQVAVANDWLQQNKALAGPALMRTVNQQPWDASVKALTQFPSVLDNMANNLSWASTLGEAYSGQPSEVMAAIQTLRAQAKARGALQSGARIRQIYGNTAWRGGYRMAAQAWARADPGFRSSNAFSGLTDRLGHGGGWQARAESFRGWGSMRASGFSGGRFGGGRFGGGHFGGPRR
jgi:hypothetical protein